MEQSSNPGLMLYILGHMNCLRVSENGLKSYLTLEPKVGNYMKTWDAMFIKSATPEKIKLRHILYQNV